LRQRFTGVTAIFPGRVDIRVLFQVLSRVLCGHVGKKKSSEDNPGMIKSECQIVEQWVLTVTASPLEKGSWDSL
jgi:hypothetical protein